MKLAVLLASFALVANANAYRFGLSSLSSDASESLAGTERCGMECEKSDSLCKCMRLNMCVKSYLSGSDTLGLSDALTAGDVGACSYDSQGSSMLESVIENIPNYPATVPAKKQVCEQLREAIRSESGVLERAYDKATQCYGKVQWKEVAEGRADHKCGMICPLADAECRCGRASSCVWKATRLERVSGRAWYNHNWKMSMAEERQARDEVFDATVTSDLEQCLTAENGREKFDSMAQSINTAMRYAKKPRTSTHVYYKKNRDLFAVRDHKKIIKHDTHREIDSEGLKHVCATLVDLTRGKPVWESAEPLTDALYKCLPEEGAEL